MTIIISAQSATSLVTPTPTILVPRLLMSRASACRKSTSTVGLPSVMSTITFGTSARSPLASVNISVLVRRSPPVVWVLPPQYSMFRTAPASDLLSKKLDR